MFIYFFIILVFHFFAAGLFMLIFGIHKFKVNHTGKPLISIGTILVIINGFIIGIYLYFFIGFSTGLIRLM